MSARPLRIACLQTRPRPDFAGALGEALALAEAAVAEGAGLLALPEHCGGLRSEGASVVPPAAAEAEHPVLAGLADFAARHGVWMLIGSLAIPGPEGGIRNRSMVLDDAGRIRARYDRIHRFDVALSGAETCRESDRGGPGGVAALAQAPFGLIGMSLCDDLRCPLLYRDLARAGAEILAVPAAFTRRDGGAPWRVLNRARAIENGAFVVAPGAVGPVEGGGACHGHSLIVGPWGEVLAEGGDAPGLVLATVDLAEVETVRARIPSLAGDRPYRMPAED
ncbi:MAG TPA: nitrilase-related carbon-nitrogen hydrolase [Amaricoccus sp.]|uniref:nitrilase-related carbon-nitrogen hydrolase n=1 Tax=Amaricoccus sp. TaxID=1872485 RepID=UPI002CD2FCC3|nr:nitrilase-related carbon-nitrogen hydrolase [Amaricoccus sp.]HMQ94367.1 nitrilase-related carbon-nitrogen hydrolase [Amaricoccus sp.]HMR54631.1 nitrilase-related carbon-nitrogen hydrolase [Amaricoccus sp.]HMR62067.1 nitrilase-related carbon-nitrogen hydrolase [Amaricoccus sp.]HMU01674.1 nitrilase-related carbon-nitrogen hydrolase [Amaricoccus sp.]